jgi:hypothetical protein
MSAYLSGSSPHAHLRQLLGSLVFGSLEINLDENKENEFLKTYRMQQYDMNEEIDSAWMQHVPNASPCADTLP